MPWCWRVVLRSEGRAPEAVDKVLKPPRTGSRAAAPRLYPAKQLHERAAVPGTFQMRPRNLEAAASEAAKSRGRDARLPVAGPCRWRFEMLARPAPRRQVFPN